jgi:hypothetical protein
MTKGDIMDNIPYNEIDIEMRPLIKAMNSFKGLTTTECCFGHGKYPPRVWLKFDSITSLNFFLWAGCFRYFNINTNQSVWHLRLHNADTDRDGKCINLMLEYCCKPLDKEMALTSIIELSERITRAVSENFEFYKGRKQ